MPDDPNSGYRYRLPANLRQQVGLGRIGTEARTRGVVRSGLGIESIERGFLNGVRSLDADLTGLNSSTFALADPTDLAWDVGLSGKRPAEVRCSALVQYVTGGGYLALSLFANGAEVSSAGLGLWYTDTAATWYTVSIGWVVDEPLAGTNTFGLAYKVFSAGSLTVSSGVPVQMMVKEL